MRLLLQQLVVCVTSLLLTLPYSSAVSPPLVCPSGWNIIGTSCFKYVSLHKTASDAAAYCQSMGPAGSDLATIKSQAVNDFLVQEYGNNEQLAWIGLNDQLSQTYVFKWPNGDFPMFLNWHPGQPDGGYGKFEHCVIMVLLSQDTYKGTWYDVPCVTTRPFLCSFPAVTRKDTCASSPCTNGGTCLSGPASYACICPKTYTGSRCEQRVHECTLAPCKNGGRCLALLNGYLCDCIGTFCGPNCEQNCPPPTKAPILDKCASSPCQNGGTCTTGSQKFSCSCPTPFTGTQCQTRIHDCAFKPCKNGGRCMAFLNGYTCQCAKNYCGTNCQLARFSLSPPQFPDQSLVNCGSAPNGCQDAYNNGARVSGVYTVDPDGRGTISVWCDFVGGKGWLVFQRRQDGSVDFHREWTDYAQGFGSLSGEHWLGNDNLHRLTRLGPPMSVHLEDFSKQKADANYALFKVAGSAQKYEITISGYTGTAGDSLTPSEPEYNINGMKFSTKDSDNDAKVGVSCSSRFSGAWWYNACFNANPNGVYRPTGVTPTNWNGIIWYPWKGETVSLKKTVLRINV